MNLDTPAGTTLALFGGVAAVLSFASAVGLTLKRAVARGRPHAVIDNLNDRVNAWWVMVAAIAAAFVFGRAGVMLLFAFVSWHALREVTTLLPTRRADHVALAAAFFVVLPLQYAFAWSGWYGMFAIFIPVYAFLVLPILAALGGDTQHFLSRSAQMQWGLMVSVYCISHLPALVALEIPGFEQRQLLLIAFVVIVVQGSDVLQYVFGKLFGRRLVAPQLSPSKTWEGLLGGVAAATALGAALHVITPFSAAQAAALSFVMCAMGFLGGLVMSAVKRDRGVKDWGRLIEGHGGMLDRLDSLVFAAPVFFHLVRYFWTP
ncbi:MAG: phosphatidate cytidylyltransferase [Rubrivivax sp.]